VAAAGCHCLVEKPLAWPATKAQVDQLVGAFEQRQLLLQLVTQWPTTLPAFSELHGAIPATVDQFAMRLSPISIGPTMVTDSAPHFISMLQALLGPGDCENSSVTFLTNVDEHHSDSMELTCDYHHSKGICRGRLLLQTCQQQPRPAWYQINEQRADRQVELPAYRQYLTALDRRVALSDPMHLVAAEFVRRLENGEETDSELLRAGHRNLRQLAAAWR
jgi:predicted dehydrogenase